MWLHSRNFSPFYVLPITTQSTAFTLVWPCSDVVYAVPGLYEGASWCFWVHVWYSDTLKKCKWTYFARYPDLLFSQKWLRSACKFHSIEDTLKKVISWWQLNIELEKSVFETDNIQYYRKNAIHARKICFKFCPRWYTNFDCSQAELPARHCKILSALKAVGVIMCDFLTEKKTDLRCRLAGSVSNFVPCAKLIWLLPS